MISDHYFDHGSYHIDTTGARFGNTTHAWFWAGVKNPSRLYVPVRDEDVVSELLTAPGLKDMSPIHILKAFYGIDK
jgi:hypothetical protein